MTEGTPPRKPPRKQERARLSRCALSLSKDR